MKRFRNWLLFMLVVLLWSSNWAVMKSGLKVANPLTFVMHRFFFASIALSPFLILLRGRIPRDKDTWIRLLLLSIVNTAGILSTNIGLVYEKSGIGAVLTYTQPLFVFCLAVPFLKEEMSPRRIMGIVAGFVGVAFLYLERIASPTTISYSVLFLLLGAFLWAITVIYYKRALTHLDPIVANVIQLVVGLLVLSIATIAFGELSFVMSGTYLSIVLYMSVGASAVAMTIWMFLVREEEAIVVSASSFIVPMAALIFGWLLLQETVELKSIVGFILISLGIYLVNEETKRGFTG
jgi:drug/metabolite transporter (DMT)-like permease